MIYLFMQSLKNSLHFILDTASGDHPFDPYLALLKVGGVMALLSFPGEIRVNPATLNLGNIYIPSFFIANAVEIYI